MNTQKTYRIKITFSNGSSKWIQANKKKLQKCGSVVTYVFRSLTDEQKVDRITVRLWNENTGKFYSNVSFDHILDYHRGAKHRIKVTYKWGETENMYIGRSTGFVPCYLVIKRRDSIGGGGLLANSIKNIQLVA